MAKCRLDLRGHRLVQHRIEGFLEQGPLAPPGLDFGARLGVAGQAFVQRTAFLPGDLAIGISVQRPIFTLRRLSHLIRLKEGFASSPINSRKALRARDNLDITVPTGTPVISATSR